ncbi:clc channel [Sistotremastrum suecicum HHB10207 ss-3]|uniref:Clc channel n=1 Tax=Sistotremastrum suecicum HHB10207 ss-3 TaxID=1314776 RepID=A0A166HBK5_9AGAM|nr:clc channel [Sistotremastrum suecicum HHB10207 ss-3]
MDLGMSEHIAEGSGAVASQTDVNSSTNHDPRLRENQSDPTSEDASDNINGTPTSFFGLKRPPSAYDEPLEDDYHDQREGRKPTGIRVWYSSFQSIDWLHDAIKDVSRLRRLRKRRSLKGKIISSLDRLMGWFIVSIIGFLTASISFMIVRSEMWLFDLKEGFCEERWWKSKAFCCSIPQGDFDLLVSARGETCPQWRTWAHTFTASTGEESWVIEYASYTIVALALALLSSFLTINLTASSSFITSKDSAVLASDVQGQKSAPEVPPKRRVMYYAAGSGIPEIKTILSGFVIHGYLGGRTLFTKAVGLSLSVASGLSLGKEGPMVHIACCVGNIVSRFFQKYETNEAKRREVLSAASAAGVAVAFAAPVGGVLFSLEEVSYFFPSKVIFFCAMIAAVTLKVLDPFGTGKLVLFQVTYDKPWHAYELPLFLVLGVFGGVYGAYFSKLNFRWSKYVRNGTWLRTHPMMEVFLVTLVTTMFGFLNPYTRMGGTELVYNLFAECRMNDTHEGLCLDTPEHAKSLIAAIAVALVVKGMLTIVTFGIKVPAGIFIPTLGVGACFGRIVGLTVQYLQWKYPDHVIFSVCHGDRDCVLPGIYAMVGAAATLSGVTRTTVSLAVIMFELTDTLSYTVPVMLSILVAKTVADALEPKGIYDLVIDLSQLPYLDSKHQHLWGDLEVIDATDQHVPVIHADQENTVESLNELLQSVLASGEEDVGFPVIRESSDGPRVVGYLGANELEHALSLAADDEYGNVRFRSMGEVRRPSRSSPRSSVYDTPVGPDRLDFTLYMDQAPLTVQTHSPLELVQQMFVKLGARYIMVTRGDGTYEGVIEKKTWLAFLSELDG